MSIKTKNIISITEARGNIFDIAEKIQEQGNHYIFTENGKAKMAVMSANEYDSLMEDLALVNDTKFAAKMKLADEELVRGDYITLRDFEKELGIFKPTNLLVMRDKTKKIYKTSKKKK